MVASTFLLHLRKSNLRASKFLMLACILRLETCTFGVHGPPEMGGKRSRMAGVSYGCPQLGAWRYRA
jgi:hypothetical protein